MAWICPRCRTRYTQAEGRCPADNKRLTLDRTGQTIANRYVLRELLGVGGMNSAVWMAWQQSTQRQVAIKLLPAGDADAADRFTRGARIASNLNHANITVVHDYGIDGDLLFLVTELLEGQTLHRALRNGPMPSERVIHIALQILRGLDHAHRRNVVHRDIKPGNLFLCWQDDEPDFVKILDFGIARAVDDADDQSMPGVELNEITTTRQVCGTPQYMAPEQVTFGQIDGRTDLYAVGIMLYRMLTGRLPFTGDTHRDLFRHHLYTAPPPFAEVRPDLKLPAPIEAAVLKALAKEPDRRYGSAAEMRDAFKALRVELGLVGPDSVESTPYSQQGMNPASITVTPPQRNRLVPALLLLLAAGGAAAFLLWPKADPDPVESPAEPPEPVATRTARTPPPVAKSLTATPDAGPPDRGPPDATAPVKAPAAP